LCEIDAVQSRAVIRFLREWRATPDRPAPLTGRELRALLVVTVAVALTRLAAIARTPWDWDELLFMLGVRHYDVAAHHPHPPGFPLFMLAAKAVRLLVPDDFRSVQLVTVAFACLVFPAMYALARALRFEKRTGAIAALLCAFLPNVWFYGGTAFSDIPAMVVLVGGAAAMFASRWCETERAAARVYWMGTLLLGIAMAFRPQNALMAAAPWLAGSWSRWRTRRRDPLLSALAIAAVVSIAYGGAALATGWDAYREAVAHHREYVLKIDSYRNPARAPLGDLVYTFAADPFHARKAAIVIAAFSLLALLRARRPSLEALVTFAPFLLFAWLMLDPFGASRLSLGYMPLFALLAAEGFAALGALVPRPRAATAIQWICAAIVVTRFAVWTLPALSDARRNTAPPIALANWVRTNLDPRKAVLYVHGSMGPYAEYYFGGYRQREAANKFTPRDVVEVRDAWLIREGITDAKEGVNFIRPRKRLWNIARQRYFEVSIAPIMAVAIEFASGWYEEEVVENAVWRWMGKESVTHLPPLEGRGQLLLRFYLPIDGVPKPATVTMRWNGRVIDTFAATAFTMEKNYTVDSVPRGENELRIVVDEVVNPARMGLGDDARDLGLQLRSIGWGPATR
jgi:hypothetical protein